MKKILLIVALCFSLVQVENVFGNCEAKLLYQKSSDMSTSYMIPFFSPSFQIFIVSGETIYLTFQPIWSGCSCHSGNPSWYLNSTLIAQNVASLSVSALGHYQCSSVNSGSCLTNLFGWDFTLVSSPTGINNLASSPLPFPFSQSSNINTNNLRYKIINPLGQIIEQGNFSGEIILRNKNPQHSLAPGIYFVIYSDADDNRQVLTDKVLVSNR